jgi:hypothetical protein
MTRSLIVTVVVPFLAIGCAAPPPPAAAPAVPKTHMNMLQLMRAFPFPHSNVVFDTQGVDPEGAEKKQSQVFRMYQWADGDVYAGWSGVENSALALAEMAPLLLLPRACANGKPAPVDRDDWKKAVEGLASVGEAVAKEARAKNLDAMVDLSEKVSNACAACHDVYRDVDLSGGVRCEVRPKANNPTATGE